MIIGRHKEKTQLNKAYASKEAEFIVVYGRRRVGKTYLIREFFSCKKCLLMHVTGVDRGNLKTQITKFTESISKSFFNDTPLEVPKSWEGAFKLLHKQITDNRDKKIVIFLDELPWLSTRRSGLLQTIDHYWNHHWSKLKNLTFIVCGSSASWMIKNIIYNKGGLHNRASCEICLLPFTLSETHDFLRSRKVKLNKRQILSLYMALGGVPYYLKYIEPGLSASENIQQIIFDNNAPLKHEFSKLFKSLFENAEAYIELVKLLSKNRSGMTRAEIQTIAKLSTNGGRLSERLSDLCRTGFIEEHISWHRKTGEFYKITDEFCLFYLHWIGTKRSKRFTKNHWIDQSRSQAYKSWAGYSFESICFKHIEQIISALKIKSGGIIDSWRFIPRKDAERGAQIDLLIDRNDNAITLIEIKHTDKVFSINKSYAENLKNKIDVFKTKTKTNKQLFLVIVSVSGIRINKYYDALIDDVVLLDDLFVDVK